MDIAGQKVSDPYAPPKAVVDGGGRHSERSRWVAVLLAALLSPIYAMLYLAAGWRALGYLAASVGLLALAILLTTFLGAPMGTVEVIGALGIRVAGSVDAYQRAKGWQVASRLPWYARWPGLLSITAAALLGLVALRAFVIEPFRIPSGAMIPTLLVGDYILVDKHSYGLRPPYADRPLVMLGRPKHGDVAIFLFPEKPELPYIKRVVGVPGDRVAYIARSCRSTARKSTPRA